MNRIEADIAVIGGGASGLAAAIGALEAYSLDVVIAERLEKTGRKLLATGNGRCNLGNRSGSASAYHGSFGDIMKIMERSPSAEKFFTDMGVICTADSQGRIYPRSLSSASVLGALRIHAQNLGCREICGFNAKSITATKNGFKISSEDAEIHCKRVIAACGGYAAPVFGTDGSAVRMLRDMGYKTAKVCPAVAPLRVSSESVKGLKGVRVRGVVSAFADGRLLRSEEGEIQFTENSLSGICVFNMAYLMAEFEGRLTLKIDLLPDMKKSRIEELLCLIQAERYDCGLEELLTGIFPKNLAVYLVKNALGIPMSNKVGTLKYPQLQKLAEKIKSLEFKITGCSSWQNAQATMGGICRDCVDENLQSVLHNGLYFCGEILDVAGDCGGYNLRWAWSSGLLAGRSCALSLKEEFERD